MRINQVGFHYSYTFFDQNTTFHTVMSLRIEDCYCSLPDSQDRTSSSTSKQVPE